MEWRCEWCGKPHEEDDPPCDNCGHGSFEKAVVRQTDLADDGPETTLVWVCTDCGREHPKHAPPCSRCGNTTLEKQRQQVDEDDLTAPGYLDLMTPRYLAAVSVTLVIAAIVIAGLLGVVDLPGFDQRGLSDVENVPGNAATAGDIDLATVEKEYVRALNERMDGPDVQRLERSDSLDETATRVNKRSIKAEYANGSEPTTERVVELVAGQCERYTPITFNREVSVSIEGDETAAQLGDSLAKNALATSFVTFSEEDRIGVDIHYLNGELILRQLVCVS